MMSTNVDSRFIRNLEGGRDSDCQKSHILLTTFVEPFVLDFFHHACLTMMWGNWNGSFQTHWELEWAFVTHWE